ncbi:hypothetical protein ACQ4LE_010470 [Meloidogyne hapla]|uniref:Uncharacterized protein n=1 Tax=Meloidogyne hapla TaxID=6305 RepID=A0A1I8C1E8_MELHA
MSSINIFLLFIFSTTLLFKFSNSCKGYWATDCDGSHDGSNGCCGKLSCSRTIDDSLTARYQCLKRECIQKGKKCLNDDRCCYGFYCKDNKCLECKAIGEYCAGDCCTGYCAKDTHTCKNYV